MRPARELTARKIRGRLDGRENTPARVWVTGLRLSAGAHRCAAISSCSWSALPKVDSLQDYFADTGNAFNSSFVRRTPTAFPCEGRWPGSILSSKMDAPRNRIGNRLQQATRVVSGA